MTCLVKCYADGIERGGNVIVISTSGNLPSRDPKGFIPSDGDRVFLWRIEQGPGRDGLAQRGRLQDFRQEGKTFRFQVRNAEWPVRPLSKRDLKNSSDPIKQFIRRESRPSVRNISDPVSAFLGSHYNISQPIPAEGITDFSVSGNSELIEDVDELRNQRGIDETTRERFIQARLGQGQFRQDIMRRWQGACAVTGCTQPEVLRASHIRPWRESSNEERLDPANGILLAANLDALFDRFLISFDDDGHMRISDRVEQSCRELFGLPARLRGDLTDQEKSFLCYHRD